jgi:hypothetical protein
LFCEVHRGKKDFDVHYILSRRQGEKHATVWEWTNQVDFNTSESIVALAEKAEEFSRGPLKKVLTEAGLTKPVPAARASSDLPAKAEDEIWEWTELGVLSGLRRLHGEIRAKGESPQLLGALAIGYANLGTLTENLFSPASKVCTARALLYAERSLRQSKSSAWALWQRAYIRTIVGIHRLAGLDVEAAQNAQGKSPPNPPVPFWADHRALLPGETPQNAGCRQNKTAAGSPMLSGT